MKFGPIKERNDSLKFMLFRREWDNSIPSRLAAMIHTFRFSFIFLFEVPQEFHNAITTYYYEDPQNYCKIASTIVLVVAYRITPFSATEELGIRANSLIGKHNCGFCV